MTAISGAIEIKANNGAAETNGMAMETVRQTTNLNQNEGAKMNVNLIEISEIKINETVQINEDLVDQLAESIEIVGLLNPITLTPDFKLVAGRYRLEACKSIGHKTIPATIVTLNELEQRIATIDENIVRKRLSRMEQGEQLSERRKIYELLFPETKHGVAGALAKHNGATDKLSFAADVASKTGQTARNVNRQIRIVESLSPEVRDLVRETAIANNFSELLKLSGHDFDTQLDVAGLIYAGKAKTIADANRLLDAPYLFASTEKGKFQKSVKSIEKALTQLIDKGEIQNHVESISEKNYVFYKSGLMSDLESLKNLQKRLHEAIAIFEDGISNLEANTFVICDNNQELALAE